MMLFVFEGAKTELNCFDTIKQVFFHGKNDDTFVCTYKSNIYSLYNKLNEHDILSKHSADTVSVLTQILDKEEAQKLADIEPSDVSEIYLFFDYEPHENSASLDEKNNRIAEMLSYFDNETENGKLYINYPMVESLRYTKQLPDANYHTYTIGIDQCKKFKKIAREFSHYNSDDHIILMQRDFGRENKLSTACTNWRHLIEMNVGKANYICNGVNQRPQTADENTQKTIFDQQLAKHVKPNGEVAILNAFPIFVFEHFRHKGLDINYTLTGIKTKLYSKNTPERV